MGGPSQVPGDDGRSESHRGAPGGEFGPTGALRQPGATSEVARLAMGPVGGMRSLAWGYAPALRPSFLTVRPSCQVPSIWVPWATACGPRWLRWSRPWSASTAAAPTLENAAHPGRAVEDFESRSREEM